MSVSTSKVKLTATTKSANKLKIISYLHRRDQQQHLKSSSSANTWERDLHITRIVISFALSECSGEHAGMLPLRTSVLTCLLSVACMLCTMRRTCLYGTPSFVAADVLRWLYTVDTQTNMMHDIHNIPSMIAAYLVLTNTLLFMYLLPFYANGSLHECRHARPHKRTRTHMRARTRTHTLSPRHTQTHTFPPTHKHIHTYARTHAHTHAHKYARTHAHSYMQMNITVSVSIGLLSNDGESQQKRRQNRNCRVIYSSS